MEVLTLSNSQNSKHVTRHVAVIYVCPFHDLNKQTAYIPREKFIEKDFPSKLENPTFPWVILRAVKLTEKS